MSPPLQRTTAVVLVMDSCDPVLDGIWHQLEQLDVTVQVASSLQQFQQLMREDGSAEVVISGVSLPDGNWCDVLTSTVRANVPARVVLASRSADERFWSEAIWRGVHDILVDPFTMEYLQRCVESRIPWGRERDEEQSSSRSTSVQSRLHRSNAVPLAAAAAA